MRLQDKPSAREKTPVSSRPLRQPPPQSQGLRVRGNIGITLGYWQRKWKLFSWDYLGFRV